VSRVADIRRWLRIPRVRGVLLAGAWLLLALRGLGDVAIVHSDESREVGIVQDVVAGHWLWPRFNDEMLPDKPILSHWLAAIPCALFGFSETAVRFTSALAAAGTIWWTVEFGSWVWGPPAGLMAGVVLATCRSFFTHARVARPDTLLVLVLALALGCAYRWWREGRQRDATATLVLLGLATFAKGPVGPALFAATLGLFLLWQRDLRRLVGLGTPAGIVAFVVLGLGWYAVSWAGWGDTFVQQHLLGRYVRNLAGGLASGGEYSPRPWYYHLFFYPQHLPATVWPWTPLVAWALWQLWRQGGARDPAVRFLLCWTLAPVLVFTPAEWKLRYYLLPSLPPLALLAAPALVRLLAVPVRPMRVTRASASVAAVVAVTAVAGALVYLGHPEALSGSDQMTRDAFLKAFGGTRVAAIAIGGVAGMAAAAIAWRAWRALVALIAAVSVLWMAVGEPALDAATTRRDTLKPFALEAAARFPPERGLAFYGATVRPIVVYAGRPIPTLGRRPERIVSGQGVIVAEPAYRALADAGYVGPPLAAATGRVGALERATVLLAEGRTPTSPGRVAGSAP
jgi:4-amino-4-deoxy-L-arabinose transferase-like glycosyltransferase